MNILLGVTGSVAAVKAYELATKLQTLGEVRIVATKGGMFFLKKKQQEFAKIGVHIYIDEDQWNENYQIGDEILHIELRKWANCFVIAPLDANTLAKISCGICDNLLTDVFRAWDWIKPVFAVPAMNTHMWNNWPTKEQLKILKNAFFRKFDVIEPVSKELACGDVGIGAMAHWNDIIQTVKGRLQWQFPLKKCSGIPINHHPGAFGFHRKKNHHTGVDLYCENESAVFAVEQGIVVKIDVFTGPKLGHDWWEETYAVMVEGASGVVNYGEITPSKYLKVGDFVGKGNLIGHVKRVLFENKLRPDIPGHNTSMLHFELYKHGCREFADWHNPSKNPNLLDPTQNLLNAKNAPLNTLTWDNAEEKVVG